HAESPAGEAGAGRIADHRSVDRHPPAAPGPRRQPLARKRKRMAAIADTLDALQQKFAGLARSEYRGQQRVVVPASEAHDLLAELKNKHGFDLLVDVTCVDYLNYRNA